MYKIPLKNAQSKIVDGFLFHWLTQHDNKPYLFFIPGACSGAWIYENYFHFFYNLGYNIASIDLPNRGGMPAGDDFLTLSMHRIANTVDKAIHQIDCIDNIILVGHSLGALMAGVIATKSNCVNGLVLLAPSPPGQLQGAQKIPLVNPDKPFRFQTSPESNKKFFPHIDDPSLIHKIQKNSNAESPNLMNERFGLSVHVDWVPHQCPALVIEAELENPETHPPMQDRQVAEFYQADYILMEKMGHAMMVGNYWQDSAKHIHQWCEKYNLQP